MRHHRSGAAERVLAADAATWPADWVASGTSAPWAACPCRLRCATTRRSNNSTRSPCLSSRYSDRRCGPMPERAKKLSGYGTRSVMNCLVLGWNNSSESVLVDRVHRRFLAEAEGVPLVHVEQVRTRRPCTRCSRRSARSCCGRSSSPSGQLWPSAFASLVDLHLLRSNAVKWPLTRHASPHHAVAVGVHAAGADQLNSSGRAAARRSRRGRSPADWCPW